MSVIEDKIKQVANQGSSRDLPKYDEDFGHQFERNLADALKNELSDIVEETEIATPEEDQKQKVDVWVKFRGISDPVGLQVTFTSNEDRKVEKEKTIKANSLVRKEERSDALIKT
jgi:hypothetical protein